MIIPLFPGGNRQARRVRAGIAAAILLAALCLPAAVSAAPTKLHDPEVAPRTGTTGTTFTFTVTYISRRGSAPDVVVVVIDGKPHAMTPAAGDSWKTGLQFRYASKLLVGSHSIRFGATAVDGSTEEIDAGSATVGGAPAPKPTPGSTPTPGGEPRPRPTPTPVPVPAIKPPRAEQPTTPDGGTPAPTPSPSPATAPAGSTGSGSGGDSGGGPLTAGAGSATDRSESPVPGGAGPADPRAGGADPRAGRDIEIGGWGDLSVYLQALGIGDTVPPSVRLLASFVGSAAGMTMLMAFLFFGKRRRDGAQPAPDEVLSAAAARGTGEAATATLVPDAAPPVFVDAEAAMPRWRRPSLLEARKMDPLRQSVASPPPLSFDHGAVGMVEGLERRLIRYHVVRLLDKPDELNATEIGELGHGDEVQLLERSSTYWRVLCPDGQEGWIHKMTLGEVVGEPPAPSARDTWSTSSLQADDVDSDVLTAFMTARGRA